MRFSTISATSDSNFSLTDSSLFETSRLLLIAPPSLNGAIFNQKPCFQVVRRYCSDHPRSRQEIRCQIGAPYSLCLHIERGKTQQQDGTENPAPDKSERGAEGAIEPLQFGEFHEPGDQPDDDRTGHKGSKKDHGECKE